MVDLRTPGLQQAPSPAAISPVLTRFLIVMLRSLELSTSVHLRLIGFLLYLIDGRVAPWNRKLTFQERKLLVAASVFNQHLTWSLILFFVIFLVLILMSPAFCFLFKLMKDGCTCISLCLSLFLCVCLCLSLSLSVSLYIYLCVSSH